MTKPQPTNWRYKKRPASEMQAKFNAWLEDQYPSPKVVEEYEENGIVVKRYEAR